MLIFLDLKMLWLLVPLMVLIFALRRRTTAASAKLGRRTFVTAARVCCFLGVIVALARPCLITATHQTLDIAVVDLRFVSDEKAFAQVFRDIESLGHNHLKIIGFADTAAEVPDIRTLKDPVLREALLKQLTTAPLESSRVGNPGLALRLAGSLLPPTTMGRVHVFGAQQQSQGDAFAELSRLTARGVAVIPHLPELSRPLNASLDAVSFPSSVSISQTIPLVATLTSTPSTPSEVTVTRDAEIISTGSYPAAISATTSLTLPVAIPSNASTGPIDFGINIKTATGIISQTVSTYVGAQRRVVVIGAAPTPAAEALTQVLGPSAKVTSINPAVFTSLLDGKQEPPDLIVFVDQTISQLSLPDRQSLKEYVNRGGGVLVTGGPEAFSLSGWAGSELAEILPVRMAHELEKTEPSTAVVFIIDTSGSMGPRLALAKEVARLALRKLESHDKAGIVEFYGTKRWAAPLQSAGNKLDLERALSRLSSGGGTEIYPAVEEASYALRNVNTRTKHVIVLTDGGVESAPFEPLIRRMADRGQTLSCVVIGSDPSPLMEAMAEWGGGRFYRVLGRLGIPELQLRRTQSNTPPPLVDTPSVVTPAPFLEVTRDIRPDQLSTLGSYTRLEPRPTADILLKSSRGDPTLLEWPIGQGKVAVFPAELGTAQTQDLIQSPAGVKLFANLTRSLYSAPANGDLEITTNLRPAGLEIQVQSLTPSPSLIPVPPQALELAILHNGKAISTLYADPILPNTWNILISQPPTGTLELQARTTDGKHNGRGAVHVPKEPVVRATHLAAVSPAPITNPGTIPSYTELSPLFVMVAIACFLLHVYLRRLSPPTVI